MTALLAESAALAESIRKLSALAASVGDRELADAVNLLGYAANALTAVIVQRSMDAEVGR